MPVFPVAISGENQRNADGSRRQDELRKCRVGEAVDLVREPDNPYDANAIFVRSIRGCGVGYVKADSARWLAEDIDDGHHIKAVIAALNQADGTPSIGCVIAVATRGENPARLFADPEFIARDTRKVKTAPVQRNTTSQARPKKSAQTKATATVLSKIIKSLFR